MGLVLRIYPTNRDSPRYLLIGHSLPQNWPVELFQLLSIALLTVKIWRFHLWASPERDFDNQQHGRKLHDRPSTLYSGWSSWIRSFRRWNDPILSWKHVYGQKTSSWGFHSNFNSSCWHPVFFPSSLPVLVTFHAH